MRNTTRRKFGFFTETKLTTPNMKHNREGILFGSDARRGVNNEARISNRHTYDGNASGYAHNTAMRVRGIIMLLALFCCAANTAWAADKWNGSIANNANNKFAENGITGKGTEAEPYTISTANGFAYFMRIVQSNAWTGRASQYYWQLTEDIDLDNQPWPYGSNSGSTFQGHFDGGNHTVSNLTLNVTTNSNYGLFPTIQGANATDKLAEVKNLKISGVTFNSAVSRGSNTNLGALAGIAKQVNISNITVSNVAFNYTAPITDWNRVGGVIGYVDGYTTITGVQANTITATFSDAATTKNLNCGGLIGMTNSGVGITIKGNSVTGVTITANGNTTYNTFIGGLMGCVKGNSSPDRRTLVVGNTVTNSTITMNGEHNVGTLYMGGFLGFCETQSNVLNNKVVNPVLSITNNINAAAYVGGAVGAQATYTLIDGMTVSDGSITGPSSDKTIKNNTNFFVGGFLGMQNSSSTANYQPNKFKNIAVSGITINLEHYVPAAQIQNHKFGVGGIAGSVNAPNQDALGNRGMPENLISKGVKIYAPWAMTSPTVPNFNGSTMLHNTMTPDAVTTVDAIEKSKVASWLYSDYKLGLSSAITAGDKVTAQDAAPQRFMFRKNYSQSPAADGGVDYLAFNDTKNDDVLARTNRFLDSERDSKTVLWWTNDASKDLSKGTDADATRWTPDEQPIYPQPAATLANAGNMTDYPYYMYFFQGITNATYTSTGNADKIIAGIAANMAQVSNGSSVVLTLTNDKEDERGFDERTITVTATTTDADGNETPASGITTYQWFVNGKDPATVPGVSASGATLTLTPHWKLGQGITVNALDGESHIVATTTYTLAPGVMKTKASVADPTAEKIRSDINGRGTATNPYVIDHENALRQLSYLSTAHTNIRWEGTVNPVAPFPTNQPQGHYNRAYYELGADISLNTSEPFTPISHMGYSNNGTWGTYAQNFIFQGHFDGKGYKISGLRITWGAGQYNDNAHVYHGLFGALGNPTATPKWGETATSATVVKNLAIDDAILKHNVNNTSFKYYNNIKYNYCYVGVLAGIVGSNTTVQNIEIRNSSITDAGSQDYNLETRGLYVGGAIGSMQRAFSDQDNGPLAIQVEHIAAQVDVTITNAQFKDANNVGQLNQINVGGIIGRFRATNKSTATFSAVQSLMPKYTLYSGTINAPKAWISPVMASLGYSDQNGNSFANYSKQWEGNNNTAETQIKIENAQYFNYYIGDKKITESYPSNVCGWGARSVDAHIDANAKETAQTYRATKYQGVNYDATYLDQKGTSLALLNKAQTDGYSWVWDTTGDKPFVHLSTDPYIEVSLSREGNNFTANLTGATPQSYQWKVSFDGEHWAEVSTEQNYTVPASLKTKYVQAVVTDGQPHEYRTFIDKVEADESLVDPKITRSADGDNTVFTFNLNPKPEAEGQFAVTYEWYSTSTKPFSDPAQTGQTLTLTQAQLATQKGVVWCKATVSEHGLYVTEFFPINGATVIYVNNSSGDDTTNDGLTPETPVKTIDHANSLLKTAADGGTVDNNIIVIIGEHTDQFRSTGSNPATLTGKYDNHDYNGVIHIKKTTGEDNVNQAYQSGKFGHHNYVLADTKFEYLTFKADTGGDNNFIECHGNDVTFGKGLVMTDFRRLSMAHGNFGGTAVIPELTVVLTATNLSNEDINSITQKIHDKGKPQVVTFQSGHYGRIMGGRYTNAFFTKQENTSHTILGSAEKPIWAVVNIDIDNDNPNKGKILTNDDDTGGADKDFKTDAFTHDINAVIAGLTDGSMYGDYTINFHGGKVSYIVGGNQGNPVPNGTLDFKPEGGHLGKGSEKNVEWGQWPNASYFGRTVINVEQDNSRKTIEVGDLYAGGLGRQANGSNAKSIVDMYYYGHTEVNMKSGQVGNVYGGGAGGVMGVNPWDAHLPYATTTEGVVENNAIINKVQYGDKRFGSWSEMVHGTSPMAEVTLHNLNDAGDYTTEKYDLSKSSTTVNITGGTVNGNVYGGGYGFVQDMPDGVAMQGIGSLFGTSNINITGGTVTGNVYGGSRGHAQYLNKTNFYGQTITHIAEMNGTVNLNISGTVDQYPTISGNIYGAGQGLPSTASVDYEDIARTGNINLGGETPDKYKTTVNITIDLPESYEFAGSIYGGGEMGKVDGNTNIVIRNGNFTKHIYGAGFGEDGHAEKAKVTGSTYITFENGTLERTLVGETVVGGNIYGGGNIAKVTDNTNVTVTGGKVQGDVYGGGDKGLVLTKANVTLNGGEVYSNVFGGGNLAIVGTAKPEKGAEEPDEDYASRLATWADTYGTTVTMNSKDAYVYGDIIGGGNQANIEGNTSVTLYAGNFGGNIFGGGNGALDSDGNIYMSADVTGNTLLYIAQDEGGQDKETKADNFNTNVIWDRKWNPSSNSFLTWTDNKDAFFNDGKFLNNHNIYGGGNLASKVGTYTDGTIAVTNKPAQGTGLATVTVMKGMTPYELLKTQEWKDSYEDNENPHFYVFGGGYGKNTHVGSTAVMVYVDGEYGEYTAEVDDVTEQLAKPMRGNKRSTAVGDTDLTVFDNSKGIPNFTVLGVLGGGYAGIVADNTKVTVDGKTFLHRVYGGGFGDPASTANNTTGQVGGNTEVYMNGAHTYGDVFGGGAGVASATVSLNNVARVLGTTSVTVTDDANIYGKVFGGGDMATVGVAGAKDYEVMAESSSTLPDGLTDAAPADWTYAHGNHQSFVNIIGGNIYGEVYGGGKGVLKAKALDYTDVGRIEGNTLVHIADGYETGHTIPYVWNRIYGGCAYGTVDGNSTVHVEGGMLGLNIFGGGYGDVPIEDDQTDESSGQSTASSTLNQVLGKLDSENKGTYANILGNTKVQVDGGSWIWNRKADTNGNITSWENADMQVADGLEGFKKLVVQIQKAQTPEDMMKIEALKTIDANFFSLTTKQFSKNHNIFGGGNRACFVGTYTDTDASATTAPAANTGSSEVIINHSPLTKIDDGDGKTLNLLDYTTSAGLCWYLGINTIAHPQFSVFGAGYGANTKVGNATVTAQPGVQLNGDGTFNDKGKYLNEKADLQAYYDFEQEIAEPWKYVTPDEKMQKYGDADGTEKSKNVYLRYRASQLAWSSGAPSFTFMDIHGGGYSGYVVGNTNVVADHQLTVRNVFGAGLGAKPAKYDAHDTYTFGQVGGDASVFIKSGTVSLNVYGGGAGVESYYVDKDAVQLTDFPEIAAVRGKTRVDVYGESMEVGTSTDIPTDVRNRRLERAIIFGSIYGGGDVANVFGNTDGVSTPAAVITDDNKESQQYTTTVNIRGASVQSEVYAGGNGRRQDQCSVTGSLAEPVYGYKKLGAVYGNTHLIVANADMRYPYITEEDKTTAPANASPHLWNRLYGGCQNGTVYGNTLVDISGGSLGHNIFGGGFGDDGTTLGQNTGDEDEQDLSKMRGRASDVITSADIKGNSNIIINGGEMELTSYWLPETRTWEPATITKQGKTYSPQYNVEGRKFKINHNIYGGGNAACTVEGSTYVTMNKGLLKTKTATIPGYNDLLLFESNEWKEVYQKVGSPQFAVFGAGYGENTVVANDTHINMQMTDAGSGTISGMTDIVEGEEYKHFLGNLSVMDIVGGGYSGKVTGNTNVTTTGDVFARRVFGGGFYNTVFSSNVNIEHIDCHDIFGGGLMGDVEVATNITVGNKTTGGDKDNIYIHGNIYGGNDVSGYINMSLNNGGYFQETDAGGGTNISIYGGNIDGNIYGAGNGDYLYALDREGNDKVTVNEHYPLDPDDANSQKFDLVYTVPMRETMPSYKSASDAAKIVNINSWRPLTNRVNINIEGASGDDVTIKGDVYGGGNSATVLKVYDVDGIAKTGDVKFNIGNNVNIKRVFMGCNGDKLFTASADNAFLADFQKLNKLQLDEPIDWENDPSNHGISTLYLPTENEQRPIIYPNLLDLYFQPVEMDIQADVKWNGTADGAGLSNCTISTFCCGGNRGNMNVYPVTEGEKAGNVIDYIFPAGLVITDKIIGGCNNANYEWFNSEKNATIYHTGGYLLGEGHTTYPFIKLTVENKFEPAVDNEVAYKGGNVFGGCFETGTVRGDITVDLKSDMLSGKKSSLLEKSNELLASDAAYAALNVYGAGYGMESYVYGNTNIYFGKGIKCSAPTMSGTDSDVFNPNGMKDGGTYKPGVSANFVYGGGQQGNVIGVTNVEIFNGHIYKSVTGGSYSGYVYGSTQVKVGYPTAYTLKPGNGGCYLLKRTDENNLDVVNTDAKGKTSKTVKQYINLIPGDVITAAVYDAIYAKYNGEGVEPTAIADKGAYFAESTETPSVGWDNVNIHIDEAVYGGGYSLAQGASVMANNTTVLKYTDEFNINNTYKSGPLADLQGNEFRGTTKGFGGNTMMLIADATSNPDRTDRDHISISHQEMQVAELAEGADLFGYYYKDNKNNYRYISKEGTFAYHASGSTLPEDVNESDHNVYRYDGEGGIFGDGHLSYAEGFRAADLTGYGFADTYINSPKIINTFQRMDILRLTDNCFTLLGARDYATNATNKTPYSISRVGEIQMIADNIVMDHDKLAGKGEDNKRSRNYMGLANNIHYVGAIKSSVPFSENWRDGEGALGAGDDTDKSYKAIKQRYIDNYYNGEDGVKDNVYIFQKRNDGTARNMIGIASGYSLKIQNVYETVEAGKVVDHIYYGPIYGIVEMNLIDVREDEGGGYVYADNVHKRAAAPAGAKEGRSPMRAAPEPHAVDFLETTGNFVFPYSPDEGRYIVDDCFPTGYDFLEGEKKTNPDLEEIHYWYVTGYNYYYNTHITGFTYDSYTTTLNFDSDNKDGLTVLAGLKPTQEVSINSWRMRSGHPNNADHTSYSCDLEENNYSDTATDAAGNHVKDRYVLKVGGAAGDDYNSGFRAVLPMNADGTDVPVVDDDKKTLPADLVGDAKISFRLSDAVNNSTSDYFNDHLSEPCYATLVLSAPAMKYEKQTVDGEEKDVLVPEIGYIGISDFYVKTGTDTSGKDTFGKADASTISGDEGAYSAYNASPTYYYVNSVTHEYTPIAHLDNLFTKEYGVDGYVPVHNTDAGTYKPIAINQPGDVTKYYYKDQRVYTYTIYLTIDYVQGPNIDGHINVENCALPGEMVRVNKKDVQIHADESFSADGYYWRIGKRVKDSNGNWKFEDETAWEKTTATTKPAAGYDTYLQTEQTGTGKGLFLNCNYNKTYDYLDIPAYYYMDGYGIQLGISMNGLDQIFPVPMRDEDMFEVHNYHRMQPRSTAKVDLHLAEAVARAKEYKDDQALASPTGVAEFAEPRIYLSDTEDLRGFVTFLDSVGTAKHTLPVGAKEYIKLGARKATADDVTAGNASEVGLWIPNLCEVPRYGANAQFVVQNDMEIPAGYDVTSYGDDIILAGTVHGEGHVITGLGKGKALITHNNGHIHNLGMASGKIALHNGITDADGNVTPDDGGALGKYHCCFELTPESASSAAPVVYRINGTADRTYSRDDFRYGKVAYDLNQYYLEARKLLAGSADAAPSSIAAAVTAPSADPGTAALKYCLDFFGNGDYQYARRADDNTSDVTGITYLRTGSSDDPNYGSNLTRHDTKHTIDKPRAVGYVAAHAATEADVTAHRADAIDEPVAEYKTGSYLPLFNAAQQTAGLDLDEPMNDYIYWGQNLLAKPDEYPGTIQSLQVSQMTNRVYRTAGYYRSTDMDAYHYNAYNHDERRNGTYVYIPTTTAIDFTAHNDAATYSRGLTGNIFYAPVADNATVFASFALQNSDISRNILVYTHADESRTDDSYTIVNNALQYAESTPEKDIKGHHVVADGDGFTTQLLHLVERAETSDPNNDFCVPNAFSVTKRAWYTRQPALYAESNNDAWEGICLPFTVDKAEASLNGEITHFYGTPTEEELADPAINQHTLHHEYWLRGLVSMTTDDGKTTGVFQRPGTESGLFVDAAQSTGVYKYTNDFFTNTYEPRAYNDIPGQNDWYTEEHTFTDYIPQAANVPYVVSFPGTRYYEFDLTSQFFNKTYGYIEGSSSFRKPQTVTFNAYGPDSEKSSEVVTIPVTPTMQTVISGTKTYSHIGTFLELQNPDIYCINDAGTSFVSSSASQVLPFRTYMSATSSSKRLVNAIHIGTLADDALEEIEAAPDSEITGQHLRIYSNGKKVIIDSNFSTSLSMFTANGSLVRVFDVIPGVNTYKGFQPGIYIVGNKKLHIQ